MSFPLRNEFFFLFLPFFLPLQTYYTSGCTLIDCLMQSAICASAAAPAAALIWRVECRLFCLLTPHLVSLNNLQFIVFNCLEFHFQIEQSQCGFLFFYLLSKSKSQRVQVSSQTVSPVTIQCPLVITVITITIKKYKVNARVPPHFSFHFHFHFFFLFDHNFSRPPLPLTPPGSRSW